MCCQHYLDIGERSLSVQQGLHVHMHTCIKEQKRENDRTGSISRLVIFAFKILSKKKEHTQIHTKCETILAVFWLLASYGAKQICYDWLIGWFLAYDKCYVSYRILSADVTATPVRLRIGLCSHAISQLRREQLTSPFVRPRADGQRDRISVDNIARASRCAPWERPKKHSHRRF